jgi:hypothetical protein
MILPLQHLFPVRERGRWVSSLPGIISGEHCFALTPAGGGTRLEQSETFRGLLAAFPSKTTWPMFRVRPNTLDEYFEADQACKGDLQAFDALIRETVPDL